ncbi:autotransporter domain-containing protein [Agrobacterium tumefaciens]|nr:autotransporter domain-containing protein [Agrobacterium tumefaciens]
MTTPSPAQEAVWDGSDDLWYSPFWSTGVEPDASTQAVIGSGRVTIPFSGAVAAGVTVSGTGILQFESDATADNLGVIDVRDRGAGAGEIPQLLFWNTSSAGNATINVSGIGLESYNDAHVIFNLLSSAGTANISLSNNARLTFLNSSTAGSANVLNEASMIRFENDATAGTAHITSTAGGLIEFTGNATADGATINMLDRDDAGTAGLVFWNTSSAGNSTLNLSGVGNNLHNDAIVNFMNDSTAGSATLTLENYAQATFYENANAGSASLVANDSMIGFWDNSSAGSAHITSNAGSLVRFGGSSSADSATIDMLNWDATGLGGLEFRDNASAGSATVNLSGVGNNLYRDAVLSFRGNSTAETATITVGNSAQAVFQQNATAGSATLVTNGGLIGFQNNANAGSAQITNNAAGLVVVAGNSTAVGATIVNNAGGAVDVSGRSTQFTGNGTRAAIGSLSGAGDVYLGSAGVTLGALNLNDTISGTIHDSYSPLLRDYLLAGNPSAALPTVTGGSLEKVGAGTLTLTGNNTYTGSTVISAGTLQLGDGGTSGAVVGEVTNNGTLALNRSDRLALSGVISGSGVVRQIGTGTTVLTGNNTYTGGTVISDGTLQLGDSGTSGSIAGDVQNDGTLAFNRSDNAAFGGVIGGAGAIRQIGAGRTELTGDSSAFSGSTAIEAGTLAVNGLLGGTLDVGSGGRLQGTGTVGTTTVSGTIAPGNSIGTLTVNGDITFEAGSVYDVEVDAAGQTDLIHALGAATINGGTVNVAAGTGTYGTSTRYTILTADAGRSGTFAGATTDLAFLDPLLGYDAQNAYLSFVRNGTGFGSVGQTPNEVETGKGVESTGEGNPLYNATLSSSAEQARSTFGTLSGEIHASVVSGLLDDSRFVRDAINNRLRAAFETPQITSVPVLGFMEEKNGGTIDQAEPAAYNGIWASSYGSWGSIDSDGNAAKLKRSTGGFIAGVDGLVTDDWRLGVLAGYSHSSFKVDSRSSSASVDSYHLGVYGGTQWGQLSFRSGLAYSWNEIDSDRHIVSDAFGGTVNGDYRAGTTQVFGELAYAMKAGDLAFEPFANLAYVNVHTNGFAEQGGAAALSINGQSNDLTFSTFGMRASTDFLISDVKASARGMIGWRHAYGDVTPGLSQAFAGGDVFSIAGVPVARDAAVLEAGLDFSVTPSATVGVSYQGQLASDARDHSVKAQLNVKF